MITLVKTGAKDGYEHGSSHKEYLISGESDKANLPTACAPGSIAYTADLKTVYILSNEKVWISAV